MGNVNASIYDMYDLLFPADKHCCSAIKAKET